MLVRTYSSLLRIFLSRVELRTCAVGFADHARSLEGARRHAHILSVATYSGSDCARVRALAMATWPLNAAVSKSGSRAGLPLPVNWPSAPPVDCFDLAASLALAPDGDCAFFRADKYQGSFCGWIFKADVLGLGYYLDASPLPDVLELAPNFAQRYGSYLRLCHGHPELLRPCHFEHATFPFTLSCGSVVWS